MNYDRLLTDEFCRNIGLLSEGEQRRLMRSHVAVAGCGGVGGLHVLTLARLGVGSFTIADPDEFEAANISRQFGALQSTRGRNKASVIEEMVRDINPEASVRCFAGRITDENIDEFLDGVDVFLDGIDFFEIDIRRKVFQRCRAMKIFALTAAPLGFGGTLQVFDPHGMSFDEYFGFQDGMSELEKAAAFSTGLAPRPYHIKYLDLAKVDFTKQRGPAVAPACTLASSLIATEVVKVLTGKAAVRAVPGYLQFDMMLGKFSRGTVYGGARNPLQRLKRWVVIQKLQKKLQEDRDAV